MAIDNGTTVKTLKFYYDATGSPFCFDLDGEIYFYITNLQGDVMQIVSESGSVYGWYEYDAWGKLLTMDGNSSSIAEALSLNPLRYRGYIYDSETEFYYLQSRYYDLAVGRFISSDGIGYLGATETFLSFNLFAYCENNPVMGYDPTGYWDWGGVIVGVGIIVGTAITIATFGIGSPVGAVIAGAAITTGAVLTYAAATDSAMVLDLSCSGQISGSTYGKGGYL